MTPHQRQSVPTAGMCKPIFMLYKVRTAQHPAAQPHRPRPRPSTLLPPPAHALPSLPSLSPSPNVQNKVLIGKVAGVNAPDLEMQVIDNAPESTEEE